MKCFNFLLLCTLLTTTYSANVRVKKATNTWPRFPNGMTWTNNAWGDNNAKDKTEGMKMVLVDGFDVSTSTIKKLKDNGHIVICYISTGTSESWRPDYKSNKKQWEEVEGYAMSDWAGEHWLDITKLDELKVLMTPRFEMCLEKGCDGIEGDNVDCYQNKCVKGKGENELKGPQIEYNKWQTEAAHELGLAIGLKNSIGLIKSLVNFYDFAVNEECIRWKECDSYDHFYSQDKAVFSTEYDGSKSNACKEGPKHHMMTKFSEKGGWNNCFEPDSPLPETVYPNAYPSSTSKAHHSSRIQAAANVPRMRQGMSWANNAWGNNNANDGYDGMKMVLVDGFDVSESHIQKLKDDGHIVICYISAGTSEDWRPDFKANRAQWEAIQGKKMSDWEGEYWLDITKLDGIKEVMGPRWEMVKEKGCDGIEPDNVDCYQNDCVSGKGESELRPHQIKYNIWQVEKAHSIGLAIGLKNSLGLIKDLVDYYDFAMNESCQKWNECGHLQPFINQDKAIFGTEYSGSSSSICKEGPEMGMKTKYNHGSGWNNCFSREYPLPETEFYDGAYNGVQISSTSLAEAVSNTRRQKLRENAHRAHWG